MASLGIHDNKNSPTNQIVNLLINEAADPHSWPKPLQTAAPGHHAYLSGSIFLPKQNTGLFLLTSLRVTTKVD